MRRQVLLGALVVALLSPLFVIARNADGSLRPVWAEPKAAQAPVIESQPEEHMANIYIEVTGAGDISYNGNYWIAGEYNGKPYYAKAGAAVYLSWQSASNMWELAPGPGLAPDYGGATGETELPANPWSAIASTPPAPTLTVREYDIGHGGDTGSSLLVNITDPLDLETVAGVVDVTVDVWRADIGGTSNNGGGNWTVRVQFFGGPTGMLEQYCTLLFGTGAEDPAYNDFDNPVTLTFPVDTRLLADTASHEFSAIAKIIATEVEPEGAGYWYDQAADAVTVEIDNDATPPTYPDPTVEITAPTDNETIDGTYVLRASCQSEHYDLTQIEWKLDGDSLGTQTLAGTSYNVQKTVDTTAWSDGPHVLQAVVTNSNSQTGSDSVVFTVDNGVAADTTPPTISFTAPANHAEVDERTTVGLTAGDNVGLLRVELLVDGKSVKSWAIDGAASWTGSYVLNVTRLANGEHTLRAIATDTSGNTGSAEITIDVQNSTVLESRIYLSAPFSLCTGPMARFIAKMQGAGRKMRSIHVAPVITEGVSPELTYGLEWFFSPGTAWAGFDACQSIIPKHVQRLETPVDDGRIACRMTPLVQWADIDFDPADVIDHQEIAETRLLLLLDGAPAKIVAMNGLNEPTSYLDLTGTWCAGYTPVGFRVIGNRLYIAANTDDASPQPVILVQELGSTGLPNSEDPWGVEVASRNPHQATCCEAAGSNFYLGTDNTAGAGHLWALTGDDLNQVATTVPGYRSLWVDGTTIWAGGADGKVYEGATERLATGQDHVNLGYQAGVSHFVATGDAGVIYRKTGSTWAEFATTTELTEPGPMAYFRNRLFVGGNGPELYCWDFLGDIWQVYKTFDDLTSITRLVAYGGALLVFGVGATAIHALQINSYHLTGRYIDEVGWQVTETIEA